MPGGPQGMDTSDNFSDPFTGGGRYVPGSAPPPDAPKQGRSDVPSVGADPFTGKYIVPSC